MPTFTVWSRGRQLGETTFELQPTGRKRAGIFHPTAVGIEILPAITAMMPALFDFGALCKRAGFDTDDDDPAKAREALAMFEHSPEGLRIAAAAREIADLVLLDDHDNLMLWDSILISDVDDILRVAKTLGHETPEADEPGDAPRESLIRYMISVTLTEGVTVKRRGGRWKPLARQAVPIA